MEILAVGHFENPEDGFGLQQVIMDEVAAGKRAATALTWTSSPYVAPTRRETRLPGFDEAVEAAGKRGFPTLVRNSGGGAVAANEGSVSFSMTFPVRDLRHGLYERYAEGVDLISSALWNLGVPAEAGEVEGEFCPGAYSIRSGGVRGIKHAGLAQRVKRRAARLEALILVSDTGDLVPVIEDFYKAIGLPFRPDSVADIGATVPQTLDALSNELYCRYGATKAALDEDMLARARSLRGTWSI